MYICIYVYALPAHVCAHLLASVRSHASLVVPSQFVCTLQSAYHQNRKFAGETPGSVLQCVARETPGQIRLCVAGLCTTCTTCCKHAYNF